MKDLLYRSNSFKHHYCLNVSSKCIVYYVNLSLINNMFAYFFR